MMANMRMQTIRDLLKAQPFRPLRLVMSSGQTYEIRHPEMAWLTGYDIHIGVGETPEGIPLEYRILPLLHVTTVDVIAAPAAGPQQSGTP